MKEKVLALGAVNAGWIAVEDVPFDATLRAACEVNSCGRYGMNYACPPHIGAVEDLIACARGYKSFLLFQTIGKLEDSYDFEGMQEAGTAHKALTQAVYDDLCDPEWIALGAGGCNLCGKCGILTGEPCRDPDRALASLESYGINVSKAAALAGMRYINGENTVTYFSGVFMR